MEMPSRPSEWSAYTIPRDAHGIELLHARFTRHVYARHSHAGYAVGVTESGVQAFRCRGVHHASTSGMVMAFNPDEPHDGHAGDPAGFAYRMVYLPEEAVRDVLDDAGASRAPAYARAPLIADPVLARLVITLHRSFEARAPRLEQEAALRAAVLRLALTHADGAPRAVRARAGDVAALRRVRHFLEDTPPADDISTDELARIAGMSRFHVCRAFHRTYGMPPHAWRLQRRLDQARDRLSRGEVPAAVAAALGFADQSHMHHRFKAAFGITAGQFARAAREAYIPRARR